MGGRILIIDEAIPKIDWKSKENQEFRKYCKKRQELLKNQMRKIRGFN